MTYDEGKDETHGRHNIPRYLKLVIIDILNIYLPNSNKQLETPKQSKGDENFFSISISKPFQSPKTYLKLKLQESKWPPW
jgi:hypothetical protein